MTPIRLCINPIRPGSSLSYDEDALIFLFSLKFKLIVNAANDRKDN